MIGELINCMARTHHGRCAMCAICRIVIAIENLRVDVDSDRLSAQIERIADNMELIGDHVEEL